MGTWTYGAASQTDTCTGQAPGVQSLSGMTLPIMAGVSSDLVVSYSGGTGANCNVLYNVSGSSANVIPGQTCFMQGATTADSYNLAFGMDTFTLVDSTDMTENYSANYTLGGNSCTETIMSGALAKTAN